MLKIEYVDVTKLKPYDKNTRKHEDYDVSQIAHSIEQYGFNDPIGIWGKDNIIVEGHGRLLAAKKLGMDKVPCIRLDDLTDEQRREYAIMHNKTAELSTWDFDLLAEDIGDLDFSGFDIDWGLPSDVEETEIVEDEPPEVDEEHEPICQLGDIWLLGENRLMCGDSTDKATVEMLMDGKKADMVLTDPPYNVDYDDKEKFLLDYRPNARVKKGDNCGIENDKMSNDQFYSFLCKVFNLIRDNLKDGGAFYIWHADTEGINFRTSCEQSGLKIRQCLIWQKNHFVLGRQDYQWVHEPCLYGWKDGAAHYFIDDRTQTTVFEDTKPDFKKMKKEELLKLLEEIYSDKISTTVIHEDKPAVSDLHPTMKPIKLLARQIKNSSKQTETVLDLFGGSGSTLIACEQLGRVCYMCEISTHYCDVIIKRWENLTGEKAVKIS